MQDWNELGESIRRAYQRYMSSAGDKICSRPSGENPESEQSSQVVLSPCVHGENLVFDPRGEGTS
jgi:hypothetical protein